MGDKQDSLVFETIKNNSSKDGESDLGVDSSERVVE